MRFQLCSAKPNIFIFLETASQFLRPGPFYWIGYQDSDHEFRDNYGKPILIRDIFFHRWLYKENPVIKMVITTSPSMTVRDNNRLYLSGYCGQWINLTNATQLQFLTDNRIYDESGELLLRYVPEHNEWLCNKIEYRDLHFTSLLISTISQPITLASEKLPYANQ